MKILVEQLVEMLVKNKGAKIVTLYTETQPKMKKTNNPYLGVIKKSRINGVVNFNYENSVNRQRVREDSTPDFKAEERKWGKRINGTPVVEHKGKYYLEVKVERTLDTKYELNNEEVSYESLKPFFYERSTGRQELEKEVILRDFSLDNLKALKYNGQMYEVVNKVSSVEELVGV
jgi:hypothetical protein